MLSSYLFPSLEYPSISFAQSTQSQDKNYHKPPSTERERTFTPAQTQKTRRKQSPIITMSTSTTSSTSGTTSSTQSHQITAIRAQFKIATSGYTFYNSSTSSTSSITNNGRQNTDESGTNAPPNSPVSPPMSPVSPSHGLVATMKGKGRQAGGKLSYSRRHKEIKKETEEEEMEALARQDSVSKWVGDVHKAQNKLPYSRRHLERKWALAGL